MTTTEPLLSVEDLRTEEDRARALSAALTVSQEALHAVEAREAATRRARWRWVALGAAGGAVVATGALIGGATLAAKAGGQ